MADEDSVSFAVADREGIGPVTWTVTRKQRTKRILAALGAVAIPSLAAAWWQVNLVAGIVLVAVVFGGLFLYTWFRRERTYRADHEGLTIRWGSGAERFYPWEAFESFQTYSESIDDARLIYGYGGSLPDRVARVEDTHGEWFVLTPRGRFSYPVTVRTTPDVDEDVRKLLDHVLPYDPDRGPTALVWVGAIGITVLIIIGALVAAFFWA